MAKASEIELNTSQPNIKTHEDLNTSVLNESTNYLLNDNKHASPLKNEGLPILPTVTENLEPEIVPSPRIGQPRKTNFVMETWKKIVKRFRRPHFKEIKVVFGIGAQQNPMYQFPTNVVTTTKYNLMTWAPKSLIFQFKRTANIYFLVITVLTSMNFSPKQPISQILTFCFVLFFTMLKEGYEDFMRYRQDKEINLKMAKVWNHRTNEWENKYWQDLKVGEVVRVEKNQQFPADLLMLKSSAETGLSFVDTMNLDGETNLKEKLCLKETKPLSEEDITSMHGVIDCEGPNEYLDGWEGTLNSPRFGVGLLACNFKQLLLRGTILRNTAWVLGIIIYAGHDTKSMKNSKNPPQKISNVQRKMNSILVSVFGFQAAIVLGFASASITWQSKYALDHYYLGLSSNINFGDFIIRCFTFWVAYSHLIPISLYVALELLKLMQAYLIKNDNELYYIPLKKPANVRTSDLIEESGQVEFIFSDKTGTLTQNVMEFKKCSVNGKVYGDSVTHTPSLTKNTINGEGEAYRLLKSLDANEHRKPLHDFFTLLAVCHTVVPDADNDGSDEIKYQASSPDELALVEAAARMGFKFIERTSTGISIQIFDDIIEKWDVLCEFPFDSTRKRMSLIVQNPDQKRYILMTKGADSIMMPRISAYEDVLTKANEHLDKFARDGLRTLVVAQKELKAAQFNEFIVKYENLKTSNDRNKEEKLQTLYDTLEMELTYIGSTAIEDKLQDGVPETIATLMQADIKLWVLTGDKQETAIEIGKSCKLLNDDMKLVILSSRDKEQFIRRLERNLVIFSVVDLVGPIPSFDVLNKRLFKKMCLVIDGPTLLHALGNGVEIMNKFFRLAILASSVICCRVSPKQKADIVTLAKAMGPWITLAIGDGANDVSMIMEAHLGVGIYGKEGTQSARAADFAIGQFRYLKKLLLVHGRWGYKRISTFICYYFYKNIIVVLTEIYFAFFNGFSGQIYFADWIPMLYNAFWTSWPCLFSFAFDKDVDKEYSYRYPKLYKAGQAGYYFNMWTFWGWIVSAGWHGIICFWIPVYGVEGVMDTSGLVTNHWWCSTLSFCLIMHIITIKLFLHTTFWNPLNWGMGIFSIIFYYCSLFVLCTNPVSQLAQPQLNGIIFTLFGSGKAWIAMIFMPAIAVGPDLFLLVKKKIFTPNPADKVLRRQIMEAKKKNAVTNRPRVNS
jgi:phospholipid-transporting ATPase